MAGHRTSSRGLSSIIRSFITLALLFPQHAGAFSNPSLGIGSYRPGRVTTLDMQKPPSSSKKLAKTSSWFGAGKESKSSGFITGKSEVGSNSLLSLEDLSSWFMENKSSLAISTAIISAAALSLPPASLAVADLGTIGNSGSLTASASSFIEWASGTGFYQAFSLVFLSEIGDKTFFIAGLLSMKTSRLISFLGSIGALAVMTFISCIIGQIFHAVPSSLTQGLPLDDIAAVLAFTFFGLKTLKEAIELDPSEGNTGMDEEFADAEEAVQTSDAIKQSTFWAAIASTFALVFAAEFGDRSFLATIALSAAQNPISVAGGAIAAHAIATGIAVLGGGVLAKYVSEKVIGYIGGSLFLVFALTTALGIF